MSSWERRHRGGGAERVGAGSRGGRVTGRGEGDRARGGIGAGTGRAYVGYECGGW